MLSVLRAGTNLHTAPFWAKVIVIVRWFTAPSGNLQTRFCLLSSSYFFTKRTICCATFDRCSSLRCIFCKPDTPSMQSALNVKPDWGSLWWTCILKYCFCFLMKHTYVTESPWIPSAFDFSFSKMLLFSTFLAWSNFTNFVFVGNGDKVLFLFFFFTSLGSLVGGKSKTWLSSAQNFAPEMHPSFGARDDFTGASCTVLSKITVREVRNGRCHSTKRTAISN